MKFSVNQKDLQNSLNYCQGVIEKRSTLQILSNVLIEAANQNLKIVATDLDLIFIQNLSNIEIVEEGQTTTSCSIMYDIVRKFNNEKKINFNLVSENKIIVATDSLKIKNVCNEYNIKSIITSNKFYNHIESYYYNYMNLIHEHYGDDFVRFALIENEERIRQAVRGIRNLFK